MNRTFTQTLLGFLLLIVIVCFTSCGQIATTSSTIAIVTNESPTLQLSKIPTNITPTATIALPLCSSYSWPPIPETDLEKTAKNWFQSKIQLIPERNEYDAVESLESWLGVCKQYRFALSHDDWVYSPTEAALRIITLGDHLGIYPVKQLILVAENDQHLISGLHRDQNIAIVVMDYSRDQVNFENRLDFVKEDKTWQLQWWGTRWKCENASNTNWRTDQIDCS